MDKRALATKAGIEGGGGELNSVRVVLLLPFSAQQENVKSRKYHTRRGAHSSRLPHSECSRCKSTHDLLKIAVGSRNGSIRLWDFGVQFLLSPNLVNNSTIGLR